MNAATHTDDITQLTERCMRRLFERLEAVLDACANLDNPRNVSASLRAVSLLLRLCTNTRARPPRETRRAHLNDAPFEDPDSPAAGATDAPNSRTGDDSASPIAPPAVATGDPTSRAAVPTSIHAPFTTAALRLPPLHRLTPPTPAAALAARAGLALGPSPPDSLL